MYGIFCTKIKKPKYLEEGEPPPKKKVSEEDNIIKQLSQKQLNTNESLADHLNKRKEFVGTETFTNATSFTSGTADLPKFKEIITNVEEYNLLKSKNLADADVKIYQEYKSLGTKFWDKHSGVNKNVLCQKIQEIEDIVRKSEVTDNNSIQPGTSSQSDYFNAINGKNSKSKLLKLKIESEEKFKKHHIPGPMDELPQLEKQFLNTIEDFSKQDLKKIRKKARALANKIKTLEETKTTEYSNDCFVKSGNRSENTDTRTLWDIKEKPAHAKKQVAVIDKDKKYDCKPQSWYTIKDGKIIKLNERKTISQPENEELDCSKQLKLGINKIRNIPMFANYEPGTPSKVLYLKNFKHKTVTEDYFREFLKEFSCDGYSIRIMQGKMKGQAFIEFKEESDAIKALEILNGILVDGKPIIVQFGKRKDTS